ncbi:lipocalin family protein [Winogradskyella sp. SM1960]|uniref:lipocalin family protein n=1 Tax=Winogradskyella sp. SM1960 TaxID=2865955 RepID=UPI001CD754E2|nr:lipocalin family protein [Winogradskyella sp. SM1960]
METLNKNRNIIKLCLLVFAMASYKGVAQSPYEKQLIGTWEIQGTLMGDNGEGWLAPHKQANPDCKPNHSVFTEEHVAKEVRYNQDCEAKENTFEWELNGDTLTLSKGDRSINWLIHSIEDDKMTVGVQVRPKSENRMYVVYKKQ